MWGDRQPALKPTGHRVASTLDGAHRGGDSGHCCKSLGKRHSDCGCPSLSTPQTLLEEKQGDESKLHAGQCEEPRRTQGPRGGRRGGDRVNMPCLGWCSDITILLKEIERNRPLQEERQ